MENNYEIVDEALFTEDLMQDLSSSKRISMPLQMKNIKEERDEKSSKLPLKNKSEILLNDSNNVAKTSSVSGQKANTKTKSKDITEDIMSLLSSFNSTNDRKSMYKYKKSNTKEITNNTSRCSNTSSVSFGERLYRKSIALKETKERKVKEFKAESDKEFKKEHSFRPRLSKQTYSINLNNNFDTDNTLSDFSYVKHRTIDLAVSKRKEIESYQKRKEAEEMKEMKPTIKKPAKEIEEMSNKLHQEADRLKLIKQEEKENFYKTNYSFSPNISDTSQPKVENFYRRLQSWIDKRNDKFIRDKELSSIDSKTGQQYFSPVIHYSRTSENIQRNVFIDLYEEKTKLAENKKEREGKIKENFDNLTQIKKVSMNSEGINQKQKNECFKSLFNLLKDGEENVIRYNPILEKKLDTNFKPELRSILEPIISELKEDKYYLNKEEFILVLEQLFLLLNVDEKRRLVNWYVKGDERNIRKKKNSEEKQNFMTFQPKIREKSHRLFEKCDRYSKDLIERNKEFLKNKQSFHETEQKNKMAKEIESCTFRPKIHSKVRGAYRIDKYQI